MPALTRPTPQATRHVDVADPPRHHRFPTLRKVTDLMTTYRRPFKPRPCCGPTSALTVADLHSRWEELGAISHAPILVVRNSSEADWAQDADVYAAEGGLLVARLFAPWAKQMEPAPGTVWPRAATTSYRPPPEPV